MARLARTQSIIFQTPMTQSLWHRSTTRPLRELPSLQRRGWQKVNDCIVRRADLDTAEMLQDARMAALAKLRHGERDHGEWPVRAVCDFTFQRSGWRCNGARKSAWSQASPFCEVRRYQLARLGDSLTSRRGHGDPCEALRVYNGTWSKGCIFLADNPPAMQKQLLH